MIPVNRPLINEVDINNVLENLNNTMISGEINEVQAAEKALAKKMNVAGAALVNSGTSAIDLAVEAIDIEENDECILPTFTIIATATNLLRKKAKLILVDADSSTWGMKAESALEAITNVTKLILPVHIYGLPVEMSEIIVRAKNDGIFVLEDAAEVIGLKYKNEYAGAIGDIGVFSFYANKIITGGEGGAVVSNNRNLIEKIKSLRNLSFNPKERYVHNELGWNYRISGLSATLINSQLPRLDSLVLEKRRKGLLYREGLNEHPWFSFQADKVADSENIYWVFGILLTESCPYDAKQMQQILLEKGIETRRFFCPLHLQPIMKNYNFRIQGDLKNSELLWERGLYVPSGLGNTDSEINQVIEVLWSFLRN